MKCDKCGKEKRLVPAGVSKKTGEPYKEFYSCTMECRNKPAEQTYVPPETAPEDKIQNMADRIENIETILIGKDIGIEEMKAVIGRQTLAIDGTNDRLDKMCDWIKDNVSKD